MRATESEYLKARNAQRAVRFSTWSRDFLAKSSSESEYYEFAKDIISYVPVKTDERKAFDREAVKFVVEYPLYAFRIIQEKGIELSTPDLVTMVKKNLLGFIPLLTKEQKEQYRGAGERLMRVTISLNRGKLNKKMFILLSQLHNVDKRNYDKDKGYEPYLYKDYMYEKYMRQVMSDYYEIDGMTADQIWPHWLKFLEEYPLD